MIEERGRARGSLSSFLSRPQVSIISSSPRLGREVFLSLRGQARTAVALWKNIFRSQYTEGLSF